MDKQIEEMAKVIINSYVERCGECYTCKYGKYDKNVDCLDYKRAEALYNAGYRKIPELPKNTVLTADDIAELLTIVAKDTRKETAEKILNELYVQFSADYLVGLRNEYKDWKYADLIKRYAKSVGVEIKE